MRVAVADAIGGCCTVPVNRDLQALGLPDGARACLFDLDGVITGTAVVHARAWKEMFDAFLRERAEQTGEPFVAFDPRADYDALRRRQAAGRRDRVVPRLPRHRAARGRPGRPPEPPP